MPSEFTLVPVGMIQVRERQRPLNEEDVELLAESVRIQGVLQPIRVTRDFVLVTGNHRLESCKRAGVERIPVFWFDGTPDEAILAECDENLLRSELTVLQRNKHTAIRVETIKRIREARPTLVPIVTCDNEPSGTNEETAVHQTARELGVSEKTVYRAVETAKNVTADLEALIAGTDIENSQRELLAIASIPENRRIEIVTRALEEGVTVQSLVAAEKSSKPIPERKGSGVRSFAMEASDDAPSEKREVVGYRRFVSDHQEDEEKDEPVAAVGYRPFTEERLDDVVEMVREAWTPDATPEVEQPKEEKRTDGVRVMLARKALHKCCDACKALMKEALK